MQLVMLIIFLSYRNHQHIPQRVLFNHPEFVIVGSEMKRSYARLYAETAIFGDTCLGRCRDWGPFFTQKEMITTIINDD